MVTVADVRAFALTLPRTTEALVRDRVKFRVGRIVYVAFSRDETLMGFGFPKEEREALIASDPVKFLMPRPSDQRYQWVVARLDALDGDEMRELVLDAWRMVVPKRVASEYLATVADDWSSTAPLGDEQPLAGGMANAGAVVRTGDEVRRPASATTPAVFALVHHVRQRGFTAVPEPLGIDEHGRERWRYVDGEVPVPPFPAWSRSDELLASTAGLLRRFHDAVADFDPPADAVWNTELASPGGGPIIGHNDVCPENVICRGEQAVAIIDFDFAAPTDPLHDLGQLAKMWIPLDAEEDAARLGRGGLDPFARLRVVADAYGLGPTAERARFLDVIVASVRRGAEFTRRRVERGEKAFVDAWNASGGQARFDRRIAWFDANGGALLDALTAADGA